MKNFKIRSYCKINLSLKILKKLNSGYHNITSLITFCDLYDLISISEWQIGVFSTALYEGISFGLKTIIYNYTSVIIISYPLVK